MEGGTALDHVGIAVSDLESALRVHVDVLGMTELSREFMERSGLEIVMLGRRTLLEPDEGLVELLAPIGSGDPVSRFLARHGGGLHHLAYRVPDIDEAITTAREGGLELVSGIEPGAGGTRTAFLHPRSACGVLIELVERGSQHV